MPKLDINFERDTYHTILKKMRDSLVPVSHTRYTTEKSNIDHNDIATTVRIFREDGTLYQESVLSGGATPMYSTRDTLEYDIDGKTVVSASKYVLTYNHTQELVKEEIVPHIKGV